MPNEIRFRPAATSFSRSPGRTESGLDSVVTSASTASPNSPSTASSTAPRSAGPSRVGVPPPKKTVETGTSRSPSTRRASLTSSIAVAAKLARDTPGPSSSAV